MRWISQNPGRPESMANKRLPFVGACMFWRAFRALAPGRGSGRPLFVHHASCEASHGRTPSRSLHVPQVRSAVSGHSLLSDLSTTVLSPREIAEKTSPCGAPQGSPGRAKQPPAARGSRRVRPPVPRPPCVSRGRRRRGAGIARCSTPASLSLFAWRRPFCAGQ